MYKSVSRCVWLWRRRWWWCPFNCELQVWLRRVDISYVTHTKIIMNTYTNILKWFSSPSFCIQFFKDIAPLLPAQKFVERPGIREGIPWIGHLFRRRKKITRKAKHVWEGESEIQAFNCETTKVWEKEEEAWKREGQQVKNEWHFLVKGHLFRAPLSWNTFWAHIPVIF